MKYKYRNTNYFNTETEYMFNGGMREFKSKVHFEKGNWWTTESLNYKATTVECYKLK